MHQLISKKKNILYTKEINKFLICNTFNRMTVNLTSIDYLSIILLIYSMYGRISLYLSIHSVLERHIVILIFIPLFKMLTANWAESSITYKSHTS